MTYVVGVEGGGTRMRAALLDEDGRVLARAEHSGGVVTRADPAVAVEALRTAVQTATEEAGLELPAAALWAGLAGAGDAAASTAVLGAIASAGLASVLRIGTDAEAAFHDAFGDGPGILLIAGTGSIAWGRDASGSELRVGGWGERIGDEGSGYAIGIEGLRVVVRSEDGRGPATDLRSPLLTACGVEAVGDLVAWADSATKADVAALVPVIAEAADSGDEAARAIVSGAVEELAAHVEVMLDRMSADAVPPLLLWGGLLADGGPLRGAVAEAVERLGVPLFEGPVDPPVGAARLALSLL